MHIRVKKKNYFKNIEITMYVNQVWLNWALRKIRTIAKRKLLKMNVADL